LDWIWQKNIFHLVGRDKDGKRQLKKKLKRYQLLAYFAQLPACLIGRKTCSSAHYWVRELQALGHEAKLISAQHVKAYLHGNKNDYNDAQAIAEAVVRPHMRFVVIKLPHEQDVQALHRLLARCVEERTALCNQLRGLLSEYGIVIP